MRPLRGYNPDTALDHLVSQLTRLVERLRQQADAPQNIKGMFMALQADVQALVDKVAANTSATQSMRAAFDLEAKQLVDQGAQITALQAQVADLIAKQGSGDPIDAEDLAAIKSAVSAIDANNVALTEVNAAVTKAAPANITEH